LPRDEDQANAAATMMSQNSRASLRLLLVTDGRTIPNWLFNVLKHVEQSGAAQCALVWQATHPVERRARRFLQQLGQSLFWLYEKVDRHLFRTLPDALAPIVLQSALPNCRVIDAADLLQREQIDVVLDPFSLLPDGW
jgi:hypothetical protein